MKERDEKRHRNRPEEESKRVRRSHLYGQEEEEEEEGVAKPPPAAVKPPEGGGVLALLVLLLPLNSLLQTQAKKSTGCGRQYNRLQRSQRISNATLQYASIDRAL